VLNFLSSGLTSPGLSMHKREPVLAAWSMPSAALLVMAGADLGTAEAVGAFMVSALLFTFAAARGCFERVLNRIPRALASVLLAAVLARFAFDAFAAA
jgi:benzoate membrane transport protein